MKKLLFFVFILLISKAFAGPVTIYGPGHATLLQNSLCLRDGVTCFGTGSGSVTSVNISPPVGYTAGSAVTTSGNISLTLNASQAISASAIDWSTGNIFTKSISTNTTFTFSNAADGQTIVVAVTNTNSSTVTWPTVSWPAATAPTQTASKTDIYTFIKIGSTIYGSAVQNF